MKAKKQASTVLAGTGMGCLGPGNRDRATGHLDGRAPLTLFGAKSQISISITPDRQTMGMNGYGQMVEWMGQVGLNIAIDWDQTSLVSGYGIFGMSLVVCLFRFRLFFYGS